jgi:hypothetical protein
MSKAYEACRLTAQRISIENNGAPWAIGYQQGDDGELEPGYCALHVCGPAFVIKVVEVAENGTVRAATDEDKARPGPLAAVLLASIEQKEADDLVVERALDAACNVIQEHLGQTDGGFAGIYFSGGPEGDDLRRELLKYLRAERTDMEASKAERDACNERRLKLMERGL